MCSKGQLISRCPFGVIVGTKMPTKIYSRISTLASKKKSNQKNRTLYTTNSRILTFLNYFFDLTSFRGQGRNPGKNFVGILVQMMTPKGHFEIN